MLDPEPRPWADLVFHVLAHVEPSGPIAASAYDPTYVAYAASTLGPSSARALGEDARLLASLLPTHEAMVDAQMLAWLFRSIDRVDAAATRELGMLADREVDAPEILPVLRRVGAPAELLFCAALLEGQAHARLRHAAADLSALALALERIGRAAPGLPALRVALVPSLRLRGRVWNDEIWVGAPCTELAVDVEHVAWQAAHEATVRECSLEQARSHDAHDALEARALDLLSRRAREVGLAESHALWRGRLASG